MRWITAICFCWGTSAIAGCNPQPQPPAASASAAITPAVTTGQENESAASSAERAAEAEAAPDPAPREAAAPARLTVEARVHGKPVNAAVHLMGGGNEVASGETMQPINTQSGEYELRVEIKDASAMIDRPTQVRTLTLHAGDDLHENVEFPWAMIQLNVMVNGSLDRGAIVHLSRNGQEVGTMKSGAEPAAISPGRYEAEVKTHGASIAVKGMMFPEGATQSMPVNVSL